MMQIKLMDNHAIECMIMISNKIGEIVLNLKMTMVPSNQSLPIKFQIRQFPLIISFVMTNHKSQTQTLSYVRLY